MEGLAACVELKGGGWGGQGRARSRGGEEGGERMVERAEQSMDDGEETKRRGIYACVRE